MKEKNEKYVLSKKASDIQVPDTIQGIIAARMDRLEDNLKRTMQVASVIGRDFAFRILQTITGMREELKSYLLNLQGLEFIYEKNLFPELEYIFKHALTQEVAYNSLLQKRRKEIHEKIGRAIEELYAERLEEFYEMLAYHYSKSDNLEKACQYCKLSGEKAEGNYSHLEAYGFLKKALDLINKLPETEENKKEKLEIIFLMSLTFGPMGFPEESLEICQEGVRLSKELKNDEYLGRFFSGIANYYSHKGKPQLAMKYSEDAFETARKNQDIELMVPLAWSLCVACFPSGLYRKIIDLVPDVVDLLEKTGKDSELFSMPMPPYTVLCSYCGTSMGYCGDFDEGKTLLEKALRNASETNSLFALGTAELLNGSFFATKGNWEASLGHFQNSIKYFDEAQWTWLAALGRVLLGYTCSMLGDLETGRSHVKRALKSNVTAGLKCIWPSPTILQV